MLIEVTVRADSVVDLIEQLERVHAQLRGAPVAPASAPVAAVNKTQETTADPEKFKQEAVDRLCDLFFKDATAGIVRKLQKKYAKNKKFADLPADVFPAIVAELDAELLNAAA